MDSGTEATEVMMFANAIQLHILAIEPEARLRVEAETTEASCGDIGINELAPYPDLRHHLICIR